MLCHNSSVVGEPCGKLKYTGSRYMRGIDQCVVSMVKPAIVVEFTPLRAIHRSGKYIEKYGTCMSSWSHFSFRTDKFKFEILASRALCVSSTYKEVYACMFVCPFRYIVHAHTRGQTDIGARGGGET